MEVVFNQATFIQQAVDEVLDTAIIGGILAVIILFLFLRDLKSTTIIGLLPMAISDDSLSMISYQGLARGVAGGLFLSTICTLIAVPVAYSLIDDSWQFVRRRAR